MTTTHHTSQTAVRSGRRITLIPLRSKKTAPDVVASQSQAKAAPVRKEPAKAAPAPKPQKKRTAVILRGDGYLRLSEVLTVYPVSRAAWYAGMAEGIYPPSIQLGKRSVGWSRASIRELIANPPKF